MIWNREWNHNEEVAKNRKKSYFRALICIKNKSLFERWSFILLFKTLVVVIYGFVCVYGLYFLLSIKNFWSTRVMVTSKQVNQRKTNPKGVGCKWRSEDSMTLNFETICPQIIVKIFSYVLCDARLDQSVNSLLRSLQNVNNTPMDTLSTW